MLSSAPVPLERQGGSTATAVHPSGSAIDAVQYYALQEYLEAHGGGRVDEDEASA